MGNLAKTFDHTTSAETLTLRLAIRRDPFRAMNAYRAFGVVIMMAISASPSVGGNKAVATPTAAAAEAAAALIHYRTVCGQGQGSDELATMQSEIDRFIAFGLEVDGKVFQEYFIATFVALSRELRSVGTDVWCHAYLPVARLAHRGHSSGEPRGPVPKASSKREAR